MWAILKLLPLKTYLWIAAIIAAGILCLWIYHRGEVRIEKKDVALRAAAVALNKASENLAQIKEIEIGHSYEKIIQLPPVHDAGVVCHNTAPVQPQAPVGGSKDPGAVAQLPQGDFDPSGALITLLSDDDAQIDALIDTVLVLQDELEGKTK